MSEELSSFWSILGVKPQDIAAGLAGGSAAAIVMRKVGVLPIASTIMLGGITSAYVTQWATGYVGTMGGAAGFFIGLGAQPLCVAIQSSISKWFPFDKLGNGNGNGAPK